MKTVRIFAVDDHEMTTLGYKFILEDSDFDGFKVQMDTAKSYEEAAKRIEEAAKGIPYDILLLDIQLANPTDGPAKTGEDLGIFARKVSPDSKIVFMSSFSDNYRINSIMQAVDPEGYMVKTEIDQKSLQAMVNIVLNSPPYYTQKSTGRHTKENGTGYLT